jgi:hypothetical protein
MLRPRLLRLHALVNARMSSALNLEVKRLPLMLAAVLMVVPGLLSFSDANALTVTVVLVNGVSAPPTITARLRQVEGTANTARVVELPVGTSTLDVDATSTWEITVESPRLWAAPAYALGRDAVTLRLWPLGTIQGTLRAVGASPRSGDDLTVRFASADAGSAAEGIVTCPVIERALKCSLPATVLNLRFNLTGFATEFRWAVAVGDQTDLGMLAFTPGSSVFGDVQIAGKGRAGDDRRKDVEVVATPVNVPAKSGGRVPQYSTTPDARGFFQLRGLRPGTYGLQARTRSSDLVSETRIVVIIQHTNAALRDPLLLAKPARLAVRITPTSYGDDQRWQVLLLKTSDDGQSEAVDQSLASMTGEWSHTRLLPGDYRLEIQQHDGAEWAVEEFTLRPEEGDLTLDVTVKSHRIAGKILLGDRPIAAKIQIQDENAPALIANERGEFHGKVPTLPEGETVFVVTSETPHVTRTVTSRGKQDSDGTLVFEIRLAGTAITGRTINEDGSPESAIVTLRAKTENGSRTFEQMVSHEDGTFQFEGFDPGIYVVQADAFQKASAMVDVEVTTAAPASIDLILRPQEQVLGFIMMNGAPVAGADVYALPRNTKAALLPRTTSDSTGHFVLALPPGTETYDVIVFPRGFYITSARVTRDPKQGLRITVGQDGGSLAVDIPDNLTPLHLYHAGGEYPLPWLVAEAGGTITSDGGRRRFTVPNLEPGAYSVCRNRQDCKSVHVPRFASVVVTFDK